MVLSKLVLSLVLGLSYCIRLGLFLQSSGMRLNMTEEFASANVFCVFLHQSSSKMI